MISYFEEKYGVPLEECFHIHKPGHKTLLEFLLERNIEHRIINQSSASLWVHIPKASDRTFVLLGYK